MGRGKEARERRGWGEKRKDMRILTKLEIDHFSFAKETDNWKIGHIHRI